MIRRTPISHVMEDYLKTIYRLQTTAAGTTTRNIARELGVTPSSVTSMLGKLARLGTIRYTPYGKIDLTPEGELTALEVIRHHRLLELFLREKLGYRLDRVHDEAERLEHVISEELEDRIAAVLGNPRVDPHGSPIPARDGSMDRIRHIPLSGIEGGRTIVIRELLCRSPDELRYLEDIGLLPGVRVRVLEKKPLDGPLSLKAEGGRVEVIGHELAHQIEVYAEDGEDHK